MKHCLAFALLLSGFSAIAQAQTAKKPQSGPPPLPPMAYELEDAFGGQKFSQPVAVVSAPSETDRIFVVEKTGCIQVITQLDQPTPAKKVFATIIERPDGKLDAQGECGLLGLAFHPDYARNGRFFVYYSLRIGGQLYQRVSRFQVSSTDRQVADETSEQPLITQLDPAANHNGGDLHFGPDGYLYISVGDGGGQSDAFNNARYINKDFHAAILRIDVDKRRGSVPPNAHPAVALDASGAAHYSVPADNPFIGAASHHGEVINPATVRTEIWATGLRNPWRFSFDVPSGRLFAADVGQNLYEEVNLITKGGDYGWSHREGFHDYDLGPGKDMPPIEFKPIDPIFEYPRTTGISITGGSVYHGGKYPAFNGAYFCADYAFGRIMTLREKGAKWEHEIIAVEAGIAGIGTDPRDGELLFANLGKGSVMRLGRRPERVETPSWLGTGVFRWKASPPLIGPVVQAADPEVALKDPAFVQVDGVWHLIATHRRASGTVDMQQMSFTDWREADKAPRHTLKLHDQYHCAPQLFYFTPHRKWYLIYQLADKNRKLKFGPCFSTTETLTEPASWTKPQPMIAELPEGEERPHWIDFWVICDAEKAHLFYTSDDGHFWRCETKKSDFPRGWSKAELVLKDTKEEIFEASHTYKLKGMNRYLTVIEAIGAGCRYYKAWLADRLEGPWEPLAAMQEKPFASVAVNVTQEVEWTKNISHGELIRSGSDETMEVDPANLRFVFQGANDAEYRGNRYGGIPWRIGILDQMN